MNSSGGDQPQLRPRHFTLVLLGVVLASLIPRLLLGATQFVEYDGYWHVWIAQQDNWANFLREYQVNAHPPLYFLALRLSFWLGRTQLVYRSVSLLSGAASVYLVGRTAMKATRSPLWAALAALAYGLALPGILISNEVRTYMLSAFFVQVSFYYFLDLIPEQQPHSLKPRILFAVMAVLGCLTEYYALIYVGGVLLFSLLLPIVRRDAKWGRALLRELATFVLILALPVWEYISHFGTGTVAYDHLPDYYYKPETGEAVIDFLLRNLRNEWNWFSPWPVPDGTPFYALMGILLVVAIAIVFLSRKWRDTVNLAALVSLFLPLVMMCAIMVGALLRAYPFGGYLRQQFVLFPFFVVCLFLFLDRILSAVPRTASLIVAGVLTVAVIAAGVETYQAWPKIPQLLLSDQMARYNRDFPATEAVYIDQFNLTTFFMHHHNWKWEFEQPVATHPTVDVYKLSRDNHSMQLFRDKDRWNLDFRDQQLYASVADSMTARHLSSMTFFCLAQSPGKARSPSMLDAYKDHVAELAAGHNLCVQKMDVNNYDVYAEFRRAGACTAKEPAQ